MEIRRGRVEAVGDPRLVEPGKWFARVPGWERGVGDDANFVKSGDRRRNGRGANSGGEREKRCMAQDS